MNAAIIGMGWVTPLGRSLTTVWQAVRDGQKAAAEQLENPVSKKVFPVLRVPPDSIREVAAFPRLRRSSAISHFAVAAAMDAAVGAGLDAEKLSRTALVFAASDGGVAYTRRFYADVVERGPGAGSPLLFPETVYNAPASHIAARLGLDGEVLTLVGDAATGLAAVRTGCELLAAGEVEYCLIAAAQELDWVTCEAYDRWGLIRSDADLKNRAIFSEGAAAIVLAKDGAYRAQTVCSGYSYKTEKEAATRMDTLLAGLIAEVAPDLVVSTTTGSRLDHVELNSVTRRLPHAKIIAPKFSLGEALSCSALHQIITGVMAITESPGSSALVPVLGFNGQISALVLTSAKPQA